MIRIDDYVLEVLMRDLVGHDHSPSATATPEYHVLRPWVKVNGAKAP
jgi:hypothetical protein